MSKIRFILDNIVDSATITASPVADTNYPIENVKKVPRSKVFRSTTDATQDIFIALESESSVSSLVIGRHNFSTEVKYTLYLYTDSNWSVPHGTYIPVTYNVSADEAGTDLYEWGEFRWGTVPWGGDKLENSNRKFYSLALWLGQVYTGINSIKLTLEPETIGEGGDTPFDFGTYSIYFDNSSLDWGDTSYITGGSSSSNVPYYEIGRLFIGEYLEPSYNISYGHSLRWKENTSQYRPSSGTLHSDNVTANKEFSFSLNTIPEAERYDLQEKLIAKGLSEDFYISAFPEDKYVNKQIDYSAIVKFVRVPKYSEFVRSYYKSDFIVEES